MRHDWTIAFVSKDRNDICICTAALRLKNSSSPSSSLALLLIKTDMPQMEKGCYEKVGYQRNLLYKGETFLFEVSGATRMVYRSVQRPNVVAKVMPAQASLLWKQDWKQNDNEAAALAKAQHLWFMPKIHEHNTNFNFVNKWGEPDVMNILIVDKMGPDMKSAAEFLLLSEYVESYCSALWAMSKLVDAGMVVPDPHPYNCSLIAGSRTRALPCDFGECTEATTPGIRKSLDNLLKGFKKQVLSSYKIEAVTVEVTQLVSMADIPLTQEWLKVACSAVKNVGNISQPPSGTPPPTSCPRPCGAQAAPMPQVGDFIQTHSLQNQNMNDALGFVVETAGNRLIVKMPNRDLKSFKVENLKVVAHPTSAWVCKSCKADVWWKACPDNSWTGGKGKWFCGACTAKRTPCEKSSVPNWQQADQAKPCPPPPPPPVLPATTPHYTLPHHLLADVNTDPEKRMIVNYMAYMKTSHKSYEEKSHFWRRYLLSHHADHHPEWREHGMHDVILREMALCDFVKRLKTWFLQ